MSGPEDSRGTPEVWDGDLPDVWQGPEPPSAPPSTSPPSPPSASSSSPASSSAHRSRGSRRDPVGEQETVADGGVLYGGPPTQGPPLSGGPTGGPPTSASRSREAFSRPSPATVITSHGVVPAATIAMVSALLFYLFDLRSIFLPGAGALKWIGFCFASATVLIARYGRGQGRGFDGESDATAAYTSLLAVVTVLAMALSPWEAPDVGLLGPLSNGLIIFGVWKFASRLTERLSADLDRPPILPPHLYGLERLEMERWRQRNPDRPTSIYDIGRRRDRHRDPGGSGEPGTAVDGEGAFRDVIRLVLLGVLVFALGEPILLAGPSAVAEKALVDMLIFLLSAGMVLAAASTVHASQRLRALGARPGLGGVAGRVLAAACTMVLILSLALATPGLRIEGSGELQPRQAREGQASERGQGDAQERQEIDAEGEQGESPDSPEDAIEEAPEGDPRESASTDGQRATPPLLEAFGTLGSWLKWPVILLLALAFAILVWKHHRRILVFLRNFLGSLAPRLKALLGRIGALLRALLGRLFGGWGFARAAGGSGRRAGPLPDPFVDLAGLSAAEPRIAVLDAYGRLRQLVERLEGEARPEATPLELLRGWPARARALRPSAERLTRAYLEAAYAPVPDPGSDPGSEPGSEPGSRMEGLRRVAVEALGEMRPEAERLFARPRPDPGAHPDPGA